MNILQVSSATTLGGGERHLIDLVLGLAARGHVVHVALRPSSPIQKELERASNVHLVNLPLRNAVDARSALKLSQLIRKNEIDVIHAHVGRDYPLAGFAARLGRIPCVLTRHVLFAMKPSSLWALSNVRRVIAVSQAVADSLSASRGFPLSKIHVIQNGVDFSRLDNALLNHDTAESPPQESGPRIGMVGELSVVKGQEDFIHAAEIIVNRGHNGLSFLIAGEDNSHDGKYRHRLEKLIEERNLSSSVHLIGRTTNAARFYSSLDVFVSASRSEAFGLAMVEAMGCEAPVVATATEGSREVIKDGETGILVPVGNPSALADAIEALLADDKWRALLGSQGATNVRKCYSIARMIDETEALYLEVIS